MDTGRDHKVKVMAGWLYGAGLADLEPVIDFAPP
jgi:hypothetical protein